MIDGNLPWRGAPSFVDSGMIPQTAKNLDPTNSLSGTAAGASFESHILEMEVTKTAATSVQNGRKEFLSQNPGDEQKTAAEQENGGTSSSQNATSNSASSPSDDLNPPLLSELYGNTGRPFAADIATRLGVRIMPAILAKDSPLATAIGDGWRSRNISDAVPNTNDPENSKNPTTQAAVTSNGDPMASQGLAPNAAVTELSRDGLPASVTGETDSTETSGITTKFSEPAKPLSLSLPARSDMAVNMDPTDPTPIVNTMPAQDGSAPNKDGQSHWRHETLEASGAMRSRFSQKGTKEAGLGDVAIMLPAADGSIQAQAQSQMARPTTDVDLPVENGNSETTPSSNLLPIAGAADHSERKQRADNDATATADVAAPTTVTPAQNNRSIPTIQGDRQTNGPDKEVGTDNSLANLVVASPSTVMPAPNSLPMVDIPRDAQANGPDGEARADNSLANLVGASPSPGMPAPNSLPMVDIPRDAQANGPDGEAGEDNSATDTNVATPTTLISAQDSLSIVGAQGDVRANGVGKAETHASRNRMIGAHEHEKPTLQAPTSSANDVAAIAAQSQDSVAASSVSDPSMMAPAFADGAQHDEDIRDDVVNDAGTAASSARATQGSARQNDARRGMRSEPAGSDVVEPLHAERSHAELGNVPPDAVISANILDMAVQAQNSGAEGNSKPGADDNKSISMMPLPSAGAREQTSSVLAKDPKSSDGLAANAVSSDPLVAVSESAAKNDPAPTIDAASVGLSVIGQSTSLAPPVVSLLVQQVANPILAASRTIAAETAKNLPAAGVVKTLDIRLVPENLGIVVVKMRLADGALQVQVEADHQGTLRLLTENKDVLSQSIQSSGYKLDAMTLQGGSSDMGSMGGQTQGQTLQGQGHRFDSQSSPQGFGSSLGSSQQGENRMRDQSHLGKGRESMTGETSDGYAQENDRDRRADSIYV